MVKGRIFCCSYPAAEVQLHWQNDTLAGEFGRAVMIPEGELEMVLKVSRMMFVERLLIMHFVNVLVYFSLSYRFVKDSTCG